MRVSTFNMLVSKDREQRRAQDNCNHIQNKIDIKIIPLYGDRTINLTNYGLVAYPLH